MFSAVIQHLEISPLTLNVSLLFVFVFVDYHRHSCFKAGRRFQKQFNIDIINTVIWQACTNPMASLTCQHK